MSFDELMREFAELVGRSAARRCLGRADLTRRSTPRASAGGALAVAQAGLALVLGEAAATMVEYDRRC